MKEQLESLVKSHQFVKPNSERDYPLASEIVSQFGEVEICKLGSEIAVADNGNVYSSYSSFILENKLFDNQYIDGYFGTVGLLVNYNKNKIKLYSGANAWACLNLSIFGADYVQEFDLIQSVKLLPDLILKQQERLVSQFDVIAQIKEKMSKIEYNSKQWADRKGDLLSKMDLTLFSYIKHAEELDRSTDPKLNLYLDQPNSDWKLLNMMTDLISKQGVSQRVTKTLELEELFV